MEIYKVFISHSTQNKATATIILDVLSEAFKGKIDFYLAVRHVKAGKLWKTELREKLLSADAVISIVTPDFIEQPWFFIEWASFWLSQKKCYFLLSNEITPDHLFEPMRDYQVRRIEVIEDIENLFNTLHEAYNSPEKSASYELYVQNLVFEASKTLNEEKNTSFLKYLDNKTPLPRDPKKIEAILSKFYYDGNLDAVEKLSTQIKNDDLELSVVLEAVNNQNIELAFIVSGKIMTPAHLTRFAVELIKINKIENIEFQKLIERLKGNDKLLDLGISFIDLQKEDLSSFKNIVESVNNVSRLKLAKKFIEQNRSESSGMNYVIDKMDNKEYLYKTAIELLNYNLYKTNLFHKVFLNFYEHKGYRNKIYDYLLENNSNEEILYLFKKIFEKIPENDKIKNWLIESGSLM